MNPAPSIPCSIIRGGSSKGLFIRGDRLPESIAEQDALYLRLMGSPDPRQIDGLGGADPLTSKVVAVYSSTKSGIDVEYDSVEVCIRSASVNRGIMCGNLSAGVVYFAIEEGMVAASTGMTEITMFCRSNRKVVVARVPTPNGIATSIGDFSIPGVPGSAAEVKLTFKDPVGTVSGMAFPMGEARVEIICPTGLTLTATVVDVGAMYAFFRAADFGLSGSETPQELDGNMTFRQSIEWARATIARRLSEKLGCRVEARRLKCAVVSPPGTDSLAATLVSRIVNTEGIHQAYAVGGAISTAVAAMTEGSIVAEVANPIKGGRVTIAHPGGQLSLTINTAATGRRTIIESATVSRTARLLMKGVAYLDG